MIIFSKRKLALISSIIINLNWLSSCKQDIHEPNNPEERLSSNAVELDELKNRKVDFPKIKNDLLGELNNDLIILKKFKLKISDKKLLEEFITKFQNKISKDLWKVHKSDFKGNIRELTLIKKEQFENTIRKELAKDTKESSLILINQNPTQKIMKEKIRSNFLPKLNKINSMGSNGYFEAKKILELVKLEFEKDNNKNNQIIKEYIITKKTKNLNEINQFNDNLSLLLNLSSEISVVNWYLLRNEILTFQNMVQKKI